MSERRTFNVTREPEEGDSRALLRLAMESCDSFLLVQRDQLELNERGRAFLRSLVPFTLATRRDSEWPGTQMGGGEAAEIVRVRLCDETVSVLCRPGRSLCSCLSPDLPEDLALLRPDGDVWLGSIAHESHAWVDVDDVELSRIRSVIPTLHLRPHRVRMSRRSGF